MTVAAIGCRYISMNAATETQAAPTTFADCRALGVPQPDWWHAWAPAEKAAIDALK